MSLDCFDEDLLQQLLDIDYIRNVEAESGLPPLVASVLSNRRDPVEELLRNDSESVNQSCGSHGTALHVACLHGNVAIATALLDAGADPNTKGPEGQTCLHVATRRGDLDTVDSLCNRGANVNAADNHGLTALHVSVLENQVQIAYYLIKKGANLNKPDSKGDLPLHCAVQNGNGSLIKALLEAGSEKDTLNNRFDSPLHIATKLDHAPTIKLLLDLGCDVNISTPDGTSPIHVLVASCTQSSTFRIILEHFLLAGCNINKQAHSTLETPLYKAIIAEKEQFAKILLSYGACPNLSSPFDITALQFSFNNQSYQVIMMLLHCGIKWKRERWLQYYTRTGDLDPSAVINVIHSWKSSPVKLIDLCRISFRRRYQEKLFRVVDNLLAVPKPVKDFLFLRDLLPTDDVCLRGNVRGASGTDKLKWAESEAISDGSEMRKNEDEDICV